MITSAPDFIGEYNIPNRTDPQTSELINGFVAKYEPQLLTELLGADLYMLFKKGAPTGTVSTAPDSAVVTGQGTLFKTMFSVGDTITVNGETNTIATIETDFNLTTEEQFTESNINVTYYGEKKWYDLLNLNSLKPAIICYVYYWFRRDQATSFSGAGEIVSNNENSTVVSPIVKMVDRWNEMVHNNFKTVKYLTDHTDDYGDYYNTYWRLWGWEVNYCIPSIFKTQNSLGI